MIKHASKMICIDPTNNTTKYNFMLTSVLVVDDFGEAVPVAWAISNREEAEVMKVFFKSLNDCCGQEISKTFL